MVRPAQRRPASNGNDGTQVATEETPVEATTEATEEAKEGDQTEEKKPRKGRKASENTLFEKISFEKVLVGVEVTDEVLDALNKINAYVKVPGVNFSKIKEAKDFVVNSEKDGEFCLAKIHGEFKAGVATKFFIE